MPQFNTTIEDFSPLISYSSEWTAGRSADSLADLYSDSSFTLTQSDGASASFVYNGTGITIFGAKRGNHGFYQVSVDGNVFPPATGKASDPGQFQVPLFSNTNLPQGLHTVTITNQGTTFLDIDFITWQSSVGPDDEQLVVDTVQDADPSFVYTPINSWGTNPPNLGTFSGSSGHATATPGAFMTYTFQVRDAVSLYGPVGPAGSPFTVSLDGGVPVNYTASKQFYQPQVLLYTANTMGPGDHVLKVAYEPTQSGQIFAIDYANVYTTASQGTNSRNRLPGPAVAGIVIALLFILLVLGALLFFLRRRKARKTVSTLESQMVQPSTSNRDILAAPAPYPVVKYPASVDDSQYSRSGPAIAVETQSINRQAYVPSASSDSEYSPTSRYGAGVARAASSFNSSRSRQQSQHSADPMKGQPLPLPPTAGQSLAHVSDIPAAELRANRRVVPGRTQDFGPAPPDYSQATEPYGGTR
ncbi:hypothetical protein B0H10DRAFT_2062966 [Mycena sp. CBHHK59/15]|nr:hypothetical protein B0H10DRAFT_2062966 [Mycena sp. CBHHK59/15]